VIFVVPLNVLISTTQTYVSIWIFSSAIKNFKVEFAYRKYTPIKEFF